jgi:hypothetical protein
LVFRLRAIAYTSRSPRGTLESYPFTPNPIRGPVQSASQWTRHMRIDIYSDTVCPWCYLGKRRFELAVAARPQYVIKRYLAAVRTESRPARARGSISAGPI